LSSHLDKLKAEVEKGGGDDIGLLKVQMSDAELDARGSEARKGEAIALAGLKFFTGAAHEVDVPDEPLKRVDHELGPVARYLEAARLYRPEVNMVRAGVNARRAQLAIEEAKYFPDIGVAMQGKVVRAAEFTDQRNPFAYDPANYAYYTVALAMRWKLDFLPQTARIAKAEADLEEMRATERFALGGVAAEVEKAYAEAEDAKRRLEAWSRATQFAKQWLIKVQQGMDLGLFEGSDVVEPAKEYALKKFSEMNAVYDYNVAVAQLAVATGWEAVLDHR
jgi:outer membrane protein TolC